MLDLAIRGGMAADGTGAALRRVDVGVRDGRVVSLGAITEKPRQHWTRTARSSVILDDGDSTGARPGTAHRSGRDTEIVRTI